MYMYLWPLRETQDIISPRSVLARVVRMNQCTQGADWQQARDLACHGALLRHDHDVLDLEPQTHAPERMRLLIQITVFLEILTSCFLRLEMVWFIPWANQPSRTPRNRSPSGWRTEGKCARLVSGMPNVSSTGLKGERSKS